MPAELDLAAADFMPHSGSMLLLERIVSVDEESLVATTTFVTGSLFEHDGRIGSWVALECIAQAVAAWAGHHGRRQGESPRVGFLLGTSRFQCTRPWIAAGSPLRIEITKEIQMDDGLGQFTGHLFEGGERVASAAVTVYGPKDPLEVLRGRRGAA